MGRPSNIFVRVDANHVNLLSKKGEFADNPINIVYSVSYSLLYFKYS